MSSVPPLASAVNGPLRGIRVVDLTSVIFGPYATQMLGDLGADVIKVEGPKQNEKGEGGDTMRYPGLSPKSGLGPIFMNLNRNKRSIYLDLRGRFGAEAMRRLIATADVFVSNVRMPALLRLGLGYDAVSAIKGDIVYAHASGYDSDGPDAALPAYDDLIQARSGMSDLLGRVEADGRPRYLPSLVADKVSGLFLSQAILAALYHRSVAGEGQFIEVPMLETMTSFTLVEHLFNQTFSPATGDFGYTRVLSKNRLPFPTKDGFISMLPYSTDQWERIFAFFGMPGGIVKNPKFASFNARSRNIDELYAALVERTTAKTTAEWVGLLESLGVPHVRVSRLEDLQGDEQLRAVNLFKSRTHPEAGEYVAIRSPIKLSKTPTDFYRHAPTLGEHTEEVLAEIGMPHPTMTEAVE